MSISKKLKELSDPKIAEQSQRYFKTGKGQYGHGDIFIGVRAPNIRMLARDHIDLKVAEIKKLIQSKIHEERMLGLLILVYRFKKTHDENEKNKIFELYCSQFRYINNWDLVDCSCPYIVGPFLMERDRKILYKWAKSETLWTRRIAIITNWWFIRQNDLSEVFKISEILLDDEQDLIHKAVGWMLREAGKKDQRRLERFLQKHYERLPRTLLRYAIEKFPERKRLSYLKGTFLQGSN